MSSFKQFTQNIAQALNFFFELEPEETNDQTQETEIAAQVNTLTKHPQSVAITVQFPTNHRQKGQTRFLVGKFKCLDGQTQQVVFIPDHSNIIQLLSLKQIIKIAA